MTAPGRALKPGRGRPWRFCSALLPYRRRRFSRLLELGIIDVFSGAWMLELGACGNHLRQEGHICRTASLAVEAFNPVGVTCL